MAADQAAPDGGDRAAPATSGQGWPLTTLKEREGRREKEVELMVEMVVILWQC